LGLFSYSPEGANELAAVAEFALSEHIYSVSGKKTVSCNHTSLMIKQLKLNRFKQNLQEIMRRD